MFHRLGKAGYRPVGVFATCKLYEESRAVVDIETVERSYVELKEIKEIFDAVHGVHPSDLRLGSQPPVLKR